METKYWCSFIETTQAWGGIGRWVNKKGRIISIYEVGEAVWYNCCSRPGCHVPQYRVYRHAEQGGSKDAVLPDSWRQENDQWKNFLKRASLVRFRTAMQRATLLSELNGNDELTFGWAWLARRVFQHPVMPNCTWPYLDQSQSSITVGDTTLSTGFVSWCLSFLTYAVALCDHDSWYSSSDSESGTLLHFNLHLLYNNNVNNKITFLSAISS